MRPLNLTGVIRIGAFAAVALAGASWSAAAGQERDSALRVRIVTADPVQPTEEDLDAVRTVLEDVLDRGYLFERDTRSEAIRFVRASPAQEFVALLEEIAAMPTTIELDEGKRTLDLLAVDEALSVLTKLQVRYAVELNRRRLESYQPFVFEAAVSNLRQLADWESTPVLERFLHSLEPDLGHATAVLEVLHFLKESPRTSAQSCEGLSRLVARGDMYRSGTILLHEIPDLASALLRRISCPN